MRFHDYYKTMGLSRDASADEIKRAYRKLARKYHPDVSKESDAEERFKEVNEAYEVLKDPEKRSAYDQLGANWKQGQDFRPPPGWDEGMGGFHGFHGGGGGGSANFSDFFESLFGGARGAGMGAGAGFAGGQGFARKGADQHATLQIGLKEAYEGGVRQITIGSPTGQRRLNVNIPKGVTDGQRIRLAGQGNPGQGGGPSGDILLTMHLQPHPIFKVEKSDIHLDLPIAPWEAAMGATVKVPTLGGAVELRIPKGAQSGNKLRLKGRGLPGNPIGDQFVRLQIVNPPADSDVAQELFEKMSKDLDFDPRAKLNEYQ